MRSLQLPRAVTFDLFSYPENPIEYGCGERKTFLGTFKNHFTARFMECLTDESSNDYRKKVLSYGCR